MRSLRLFLPVLLLGSGCAYTFNPSLPSHIKTIQIPTIENETIQAELSQEMTEALTDRFIADNNLRVVSGDADAVLEGTVVEYQNRVLGIGSDNVAQEYVVFLKLSVRLRDRIKNKDLWSDEELSGRASYVVQGAQTDQTLTNELEARAVAIRQIVDVVLSQTVEGW